MDITHGGAWCSLRPACGIRYEQVAAGGRLDSRNARPNQGRYAEDAQGSSLALCAGGLNITALGHVWTAPWQELSDVSAALVGCGHVSGLLMRQVWPLALMLCADQVPNKLTHFRIGALTQAGSPDPRNNRICITSSCPRQLVLLPLYLASRHQQQFRFLVSLVPDHDGPGHPRNLVGERDGRHLGGPTFH